MVRAISRTLQTRSLDIFLRSLSTDRAQPPPWASRVNPARLTDLQHQSLSPEHMKRKKAGAAGIRKVLGRILANGPNIGDEDGCAVRFTGPPRTNKPEKRITVSTMTALLHSKSLFFRRDTHSTYNKYVRERAEQHERTKFFFDLLTSFVTRLAPEGPPGSPKSKLKSNEIRVSDLQSGDIVAVPRASSDGSKVPDLFLGEVVSVAETLSIVFCDDGKTVEHKLTHPEITRYLKVNDLNTGQLLKAVGPHIVKRQFYYRGAVGNLESDQLPDGGAQQPLVGGAPLDDRVAKYQPVIVVNYDATTKLHQLQIDPESQDPPSSPTPSLSVDLGKSDIRLALPRLSKKSTCQTCPSPFSTKQKRKKSSCDEVVPLKVEQGSPTRDAAQLVSTDSKRAQIIPIPFSVETTGAQVLDTKLSADLSGLPANLTEKNASLHETLLASCPDDNGDHDVALGRDDAPFHDNVLPRDDNDDNLLGDDDDENDDTSGIRSSNLPADNSRAKFSSSLPRDTGSPRNRKRSRDDDFLDDDFLAFLSYFLSSRSTDNTPSTDNTTPTTQTSDEDTRESEGLVVADFTHDPSETLAVLETPRVDDDFSRAKKKPCLDDRDADSPLDKDRDTMPGPEE